ncbi:hypothetical protein Sez_0504 [Streptococcus equi subsp. zooepidemicus MGCS10565]|uniref:Uncharacterized protein n=1 Tax=Streptococcus equi subsp. zooepidemicus (strain MGCS10565) TaxID=552526 RepID=B4U1K9_STREM|nr:hypothetical protein Sez_0504 [Streptococcus equi subsp. zooepidemicus MGCS10565]
MIDTDSSRASYGSWLWFSINVWLSLFLDGSLFDVKAVKVLCY